VLVLYFQFYSNRNHITVTFHVGLSSKNIRPFSRRLHIEITYVMFAATPSVYFIELLVDSPMASFYVEGDETSGYTAIGTTEHSRLFRGQIFHRPISCHFTGN
jgi:hypothetical protein